MSPLPSLLLVDDDPLFRDSLELLLSCSYTVHVSDSAEDALRQLRHGLQPALIVSDVSMPGIGGAGLLARLPAALRARTVFLSAGISDPAAAAAIAASGQPLLRKPIRFPMLAAALRNLLEAPPLAWEPALAAIS